MKINTDEVVTSLSGSRCIKRIFLRVGVDEHIPIIEHEYIEIFVQLDKHFYAKCNMNRVPVGQSAFLALQHIHRNTERYPSNILDQYTQSLIHAFTSVNNINWLSILRNEYEVKIVIYIMKFILVTTKLDSVHEHFDDYSVSDFLQSMSLLIKKINYNLRISKCLQESLMTGYSHYWQDKSHCDFNTETLLNKCKALFIKSNAQDDTIAYIPLEELELIGVNDNIEKFFNEVKLSPEMREYLPNIINNLIKERIKLDNCNSGFSKVFQKPQYRAEMLEKVLSYVGLQFKSLSSNKYARLVPNDHAKFIENYQVSAGIRNSKIVQRLHEGTKESFFDLYPVPKEPEIFFDIYDGQMLDHIQKFYKNFSKMLQLKPVNNIGFFQTQMLGNAPIYNEDRVDIITKINSAQTVNQLLAIRFLWFNSNVFLEHTDHCCIAKHWTITPDGELSRISERNSRLNLFLAIKVYWIWLKNNQFDTEKNFNDQVSEHSELLFMKIARRSYFIGLGYDIKTMNTSSVYREFINYLKGRVTRENMFAYLQRRWIDCIYKMNQELGANIQATHLELNHKPIEMLVDEVN